MALSDNAQSVIEEGNALLPARRSSSSFDLQEKASTLLLITAKLAQERRVLEGLLLRASSVEKATYAQVFNAATAKAVSERQLKADTDSSVLERKEEAGDIKKDIAYVSAMIDIFTNGHILYRNVMKDENKV
jgi:hypothetical protein